MVVDIFWLVVGGGGWCSFSIFWVVLIIRNVFIDNICSMAINNIGWHCDKLRRNSIWLIFTYCFMLCYVMLCILYLKSIIKIVYKKLINIDWMMLKSIQETYPTFRINILQDLHLQSSHFQVLTHFRPMFHLRINQVVGFY